MANAKWLASSRKVHAGLATIRRARQEHFLVFCLDARGGFIRQEVVSKGTLNASLVHPREVFYPAIINNAASIIVAHNHPSGDSTPSDDDVFITNRLATAGNILGIELLDHIIVADKSLTSLSEKGVLSGSVS
jgi:DNA repair protein RadC